MGALSADRREAAFRSGDQEAQGYADGTYVTIPALRGALFSGAEVQQVLTDWARPWMPFARHRRWITNMRREGNFWTAVLEGRSQQLQRPNGGRFGGTFTVPCPYRLGDASTCKKDIATWTNKGVTVDSVTEDRWTIVADAATFLTSYDDQFFRYGDLEWRWSASTVTGTATSTTTTTTLTDSSKSWTTNEHAGKDIRLLSGAGGYVQSYATIVSNTATVVTFTALGSTYASGTHYDIADLCANAGFVSEIDSYIDSTREIQFYLPTPFSIAVGDGGILRPGCDGLFSTCKDKFSNQINFGGDPFAPSASQVIEPPTPE